MEFIPCSTSVMTFEKDVLANNIYVAISTTFDVKCKQDFLMHV